MQEKSLIKKNILQYIDNQGISMYEFYKKTGITRGILNQNNGMSEENTAKFLAYFPEINPEWLLTGKGEMLKGAEGAGMPTIIEIEPKGEDNVVLLDAKAAAYTFSNAQTNAITLQNAETMRLPQLQHRKGLFYALEISGDSMHPTITNGDYVVCRQINMADFIGGFVYVMWHTEHGLICKRPKWVSKEEGIIKLQSDNEHIGSWETHISQITAMLEAECKISFNLRSWNNDVRQDILDIKKDINELKQKLK